MAVNYAFQDKFLDLFFSGRFTTDFYLTNSINQIEQASQMPVLLKPLDLIKYNEFYKKLSRDLFLKIKPEEK